MKKTIALLLTVVCIFGMCGSSFAAYGTYGQWEMRSYVDGKNNETGEMYITDSYYYVGTFDTDLYNGAPAYMMFLVDQNYTRVKLFDLNTLAARQNMARYDVNYNITVYAGGLMYTGFGVMPANTDYIVIQDHENFNKLLRDHDTISIVFEESDLMSTRSQFYNIDISGFPEAETALFGKKALIGDVNDDGTVDGRDSVRLMKYLAGDEEEPEAKISGTNADLNGDGKVDELDLLCLLKLLGGENAE